MKKIFTFLTLLIICPLFVRAEVEPMNLIGTLKLEDFEIKNQEYVESDDQVTIYLFMGETCTHCREFIDFLNETSVTYGDKFKLRAYEVYNNKDNASFQKQIVGFLDIKAPGVPLIIIGEKSFYGYSSSDNEEIIQLIQSEYEKPKQDRYDVIEAYNSRDLNYYLLIFIPVITLALSLLIYSEYRKAKNA